MGKDQGFYSVSIGVIKRLLVGKGSNSSENKGKLNLATKLQNK